MSTHVLIAVSQSLQCSIRICILRRRLILLIIRLLLCVPPIVPGRFGPESFRPRVVSAWVVSACVVSALGRFGQFWWVVSA